MIIGIIGKIGSGKSDIIKYIKSFYSNINIVTYSCDDIAKNLLKDGTITFRNGDLKSIDFFTNVNLQEEVRKDFHPIVFNYIYNDINSRIDKDNALFIIESALPNDTMFNICNKIIYVKSLYENCRNRLAINRGYDDNKIKLIFDSQKYYEKFYNNADFIIENNSDKETFYNNIKKVIDEICIIR